MTPRPVDAVLSSPGRGKEAEASSAGNQVPVAGDRQHMRQS